MNSLKLLFTSLIFSLQEKEFVRMGQSLQVRKYVFYKSDLLRRKWNTPFSGQVLCVVRMQWL